MAVRRAARRQLLGSGRGPETFLGRKERANPNNWANAWLVLGMITCNRLRPDPNDQVAIRTFFDALIDEEGNLRHSLRLPDQCMIGYSLLEMLEWTGEQRYRRAAEAVANFLLREYPRNTGGTLPYAPDQPLVLLADTLGMVCPFLTRYGVLAGVPEAVNLATAQLAEFLERGFDRVTGLPFHACHVSRDDRLGCCGWARGIGWVVLGLADTLIHLPAEQASHAQLERAFRLLVRAVCAYQLDCGCWGWAINIPGAHPDTSGTAFIGYGIERGIQAGVLDPEWSAASMRALRGIIRHTTAKGYVDSSLSEAGGVGIYPHVFGRTVWAQGAATALVALVLHREEST